MCNKPKSIAETRCPDCNASFPHLVVTEPADGSITCLKCGTVFDPNRPRVEIDIRKVEKAVADRLIGATLNIRSCIVTLEGGRDITLSFPKDLEQKKGRLWRDSLKGFMTGAARIFFDSEVLDVKFDDEL